VKAVVESIGRVGSRSRAGNHEILFDQPREVPGGEDRGPSPLDVMVLSVAACAHYFASAFLFTRGHSTDAVTVEVESEKDRVPVSRIGRLTIKVRLPAGLTEKEVTGVERAIKACPAYGTLKHPPAVEISVEAPSLDSEARRTA
jgi:putative redox protein